jgi:uncharacterized protein (DUF427 family)
VTDALEDRDLDAVARNRPTTDRPVRTEPYPRRVRAFLDGVVVVDSTRALLLLEARHLPVYYFPPQDVRTELLEPTGTSTHCPRKGDGPLLVGHGRRHGRGGHRLELPVPDP